MTAERYLDQVDLLMRVIPEIAPEGDFALKGGTAINLFVRDMPRLSVDIDLTYLPIEPRDVAFANIDAALDRIAKRLQDELKAKVTPDQQAKKLLVERAGSKIKLEVNPVIRGCLFQPEQRAVQPAVEQGFGFAEMPIVSFQDLYAGKICAALDRQHPRDWYDVKLLLENEGMSRELMQALLVYIGSGNRPMNEILNCPPKDIRTTYENHFNGMTRDPVPVEELEQVRERLLDEIARHFTQQDGEFLLSLKKADPDWSLLGIEGAKDLAALQWKLHNIKKMPAASHARETKKLEAVIEQLHQRRQGLAPS